MSVGRTSTPFPYGLDRLVLTVGLVAVGLAGPFVFRLAYNVQWVHDGCGTPPTRSLDYCTVMSKDLGVRAAFTGGCAVLVAYVLGFAVVFGVFTLLAWDGRRGR